MHVAAVSVLGIIFNILLHRIEANLTLDFKVTRISASHKASNCNVANTTYSHGETFKLDCKTQCVCENGRHACSSLCPKEQLPAPEDTISCRSPRLVEVPGHCCKMWLCENPTADVYATCHNSSTSPWTPCSRICGLGISTRFATTTAGCNHLSSLRLCENRKCETQQDNTNKQKQTHWPEPEMEEETNVKQKYLMKTKQLKHKQKWQHYQRKYQQQVQQEYLGHEHRIRKGHECRSLQRLGPARIRLGQCVSKKLYRPKICGRCHQNTKCCVPSVSTTIQVELLCPLNAMDPIKFVQQQLNAEQQHQQQQQQQQQQGQLFYSNTEIPSSDLLFASTSASSSSPSLTSLWDTHSLDAIDQEYLQSHQIQIANKFIAIEWILKCECTKTNNCQRIVKTTTETRANSSHRAGSDRSNINNHKHHDYDDDNESVDTTNNLSNNKNIQNTNYFKLNYKTNHNNNDNNNNNNNGRHSMDYKDYEQKMTAGAATKIDKITDVDKNVDKNNEKKDVNKNADDADDEDDADNDSDININNSYGNRDINSYRHSFNHKKHAKDFNKNNKNSSENNNNNNINNHNNIGIDEKNEKVEKDNVKEKEWSTSLLSVALSSVGEVATVSDEIQPDIIPYPPPPFSANKRTTSNNSNNKKSNNKNNKKSTQTNWIKDKFKVEHSKQNRQRQKLIQQQKQQQQHQHQQQQQKKQPQQHQQEYYEHWLLQKYANKPYQAKSLAT